MFLKNLLLGVLIWINTGVLGSIFPCASGTIGLAYWEVIFLSLIFSLPALLFVVPNLHVLHWIRQRFRAAYAFASILLLCAAVITFFLWGLNGYWYASGVLMPLLLPYVIAAELSFFFFARRIIWEQSAPMLKPWKLLFTRTTISQIEKHSSL